MAGLPALEKISKDVRQLIKKVVDERITAIREELNAKLEGELNTELRDIIELGLGLTPASDLRSQAAALASAFRKTKGSKKKAKAAKKAKASGKQKAKKKSGRKKVAAKTKTKAKKVKTKGKGKKNFEALRASLKSKKANGSDAICGVKGCGKPVRSMGYCGSDYQNARNNDWPKPCPAKFDPPKRKRGRPKTDEANGVAAEASAS